VLQDITPLRAIQQRQPAKDARAVRKGGLRHNPAGAVLLVARTASLDRVGKGFVDCDSRPVDVEADAGTLLVALIDPRGRARFARPVARLDGLQAASSARLVGAAREDARRGDHRAARGRAAGQQDRPPHEAGRGSVEAARG